MENIKIEKGENSKAFKALFNQYVYSSDEETIHNEMNFKHYEAAIHGNDILPCGVERLYKRQLVIELTMVCGAHCRYCLRQNYNIKQFTKGDIEKVVDYCSKEEFLKEVLITGGDPFMVPQLLMNLISDIVKRAPNIKIIRIGSRLPIQDPDRFDEELYSFFNSYREAVMFEIGLQVNHKVELHAKSINIIGRLLKNGVRIYSQNVLLKGVNDDIESLIELYDTLRYLGIEAHYLFHAVPMIGTTRFRIPIIRALDLIRKLSSSGKISGRVKPMLSLMTDVGKVTLYEGALSEKDKEGYYHIQTCYDIKERQEWNPDYMLPESAYEDENGMITVKYLDGSEE